MNCLVCGDNLSDMGFGYMQCQKTKCQKKLKAK